MERDDILRDELIDLGDVAVETRGPDRGETEIFLTEESGAGISAE